MLVGIPRFTILGRETVHKIRDFLSFQWPMLLFYPTRNLKKQIPKTAMFISPESPFPRPIILGPSSHRDRSSRCKTRQESCAPEKLEPLPERLPELAQAAGAFQSCVWLSLSFCWYTLEAQKRQLAPEPWWLEDNVPFPMVAFQGLC